MPTSSPKQSPKSAEGIRPPVVAIVGHIDHGKSTLLDYIRKTNVTETEAGGITQHLSAYEAQHDGKSITFLDTPGHEAFTAMRSRGLAVADVAILVVSAEDGAKPQTMEAVRLIGEAGIPYIVAFTKVDKPSANIERAKSTMLEQGVYLEGMGGDVPYVGVSGKSGEGIPELLDLILLAAELRGLTANPGAPAEGVVIEAHVDRKRGISATLIVRGGTLKSGSYVVAGSAFAPVRIMENFLGKTIREATPGQPIRIVGFSELPEVGGSWRAVESKKEAEAAARTEALARPRQGALAAKAPAAKEGEEAVERLVIPLVIKTDVAGTADAVRHELRKLPEHPRMEARIISAGVGAVSEADVRLAGAGETPGIVIGFNVGADATARSLAERLKVKIESFDVIYKLAEWLGQELEERRPRERVEEKVGEARVLKIFSTTKKQIVLGGRVEEGRLRRGEEVKILRRETELGTGRIDSLQAQKKDVTEVESGSEFGAMMKTDVAVAPNDRLEIYMITYK